MLFKLELTVSELTLPHNYLRQFAYAGPHDLRVELRAPTAEEQKQGYRTIDALCTATSSVDVNDANSQIFTKIETDSLLKPGEEADRTRLEYSLPNGQRTHLPALSELPEFFRSYWSGISAELDDIAKRTVLTLRWRLSGRGSHQPFSSRGFHWSRSGEFWHPAPPDITVKVTMFPPLQISQGAADEVADVVRSGHSEPLHHALFREAWYQRRANPRSALIIGMAAAEIAAKHCIGSLVADAQWLATNLPTPPLVRILTEYMPTLPAKQTFNGQVKSPPKTMLESLKKGVTVRNSVTHAGATAPGATSVDEILTAVRDVLWLVDYYSGAAWAVDYLSDSVRTELMG
jgi:hypothetical protein